VSEVTTPSEEARDWDALARAAADRSGSSESLDEVRQLLSFELAGAPYAVPVERVREIVRMRPVTPVPRMPDEVRGVISLRGEMIELIDLRRRLSLGSVEPSRRTRIIVIKTSDDEVVGLLVDGVREVLRVSDEAIQPATGSDTGAVNDLCKFNDEFVSMIELDRVLTIDG
jgi:purine-binding chemotaxis protein CheW